jgi:hypothetical protein
MTVNGASASSIVMKDLALHVSTEDNKVLYQVRFCGII